MDFVVLLDQAIALLQRRGRLTYGTLKRQFALDDASLADLAAELIDGQRVAVDEGGIQLIDLTTTQAVGWLPAKRGASRVSFSLDGHSVVAQHSTGFQFWRAPSWEQIALEERKTRTDLHQP